MNGLALCAGVGGIDLGLSLAIGPAYRTVCYVEREAFCASILVQRMEDGCLDHAPIWSDLSTFDGRPWRGLVDCVTAGFPCQPWSAAGNRKGVEDERWIWSDIQRILCEVEPRYVLLENVPGLLVGGLEHVLGTLAEIGMDARWSMFRASDVGSPQRRERIFILGGSPLGNPNGEGLEGRPVPESGSTYQLPPWPPGPEAPPHRFAPGLEPSVCRTSHGLSSRVDEIRSLGNACVPAVAALAWRTLILDHGNETKEPSNE